MQQLYPGSPRWYMRHLENAHEIRSYAVLVSVQGHVWLQGPNTGGLFRVSVSCHDFPQVPVSCGVPSEHLCRYLQASVVAGAIMLDRIPTIFGDADDFSLSLPEFQAAVEDCARAAHSNPVVLREIKSSIYESAWVWYNHKHAGGGELSACVCENQYLDQLCFWPCCKTEAQFIPAIVMSCRPNRRWTHPSLSRQLIGREMDKLR